MSREINFIQKGYLEGVLVGTSRGNYHRMASFIKNFIDLYTPGKHTNGILKQREENDI